MTTITVKFYSHPIPCITSFTDSEGRKREMDHFKINYTSGKRVYLTAIKNSLRLTRISKKMILDNGKASVKFGNQEITIGTYE